MPRFLPIRTVRPSSTGLAAHLVAAAVAASLLSGCGVATDSLSDAAPPAQPSAATSDTGTASSRESTPTVFAVIGDHGTGDEHARDVADLVASWNPAYVVALGDCYYSEAGGRGTQRYRLSTEAYYGSWIADAPPADSAPGQPRSNAFFPILGNHDYSDASPGPETYLEYFDLPGAGMSSTSGNERYYDFVKGPVHFFALNSAPQEPDGIRRDSRQAEWLRTQLAASTSAFNVVLLHRAPYTSELSHGSTAIVRWPFAEWGADAVLSGHAHTYERIERDSLVYFVNGLGGSDRYRFRPVPVIGSRMRYRDDWGAQKVTVSGDSLVFEFYSVDGTLVDSHIVRADR